MQCMASLQSNNNIVWVLKLCVSSFNIVWIPFKCNLKLHFRVLYLIVERLHICQVFNQRKKFSTPYCLNVVVEGNFKFTFSVKENLNLSVTLPSRPYITVNHHLVKRYPQIQIKKIWQKLVQKPELLLPILHIWGQTLVLHTWV